MRDDAVEHPPDGHASCPCEASVGPWPDAVRIAFARVVTFFWKQGVMSLPELSRDPGLRLTGALFRKRAFPGMCLAIPANP
jgi:hypothetical protein